MRTLRRVGVGLVVGAFAFACDHTPTAAPIPEYLQIFVKSKKNPWSQGTQFVVGLLLHFSNYAVA